ncbi:glycosyltransferase family 8 protein [Chamaesiphon sp.]|uniref:glycosyltransferase family 8 protein n=1 Tax=Chamaesiphon sp. TaxID=2814140 RepID=UPI003593079B
MKSEISVALCADKNVEVSLHVTLYSLLKSSQHPIQINLVQKGYKSKEIDNIHRTLQQFAGKYRLNVIEFDENALFGKFKGLHGNQFNFTKLILANVLPNDRIIYLDSDLVVGKDLSGLFSTNLNEFIIGASSIETIADSLRSTFYQSIGMKKEANYFNSGVMLMDLKKWRELDITSQCLSFANKYVNRLSFGDEAVLNCIFYENFQAIDASYNHPLYPDSARHGSLATPLVRQNDQNEIFHFVGSPKPFDFLGEFIHPNYAMFSDSLAHTTFRNYKSYLDFSFAKLKRTVNLSRSYYKRVEKMVECQLTSWRAQIPDFSNKSGI